MSGQCPSEYRYTKQAGSTQGSAGTAPPSAASHVTPTKPRFSLAAGNPDLARSEKSLTPPKPTGVSVVPLSAATGSVTAHTAAEV